MASLTVGQKLFADLQIDFDRIPFDLLDDYAAIKYFLTLEDEPPSDAKNIEKVDRYLHVFNHLCDASAWEQAWQVLQVRPEDKPTVKELHEQLGTWGYYREQVKLYEQLLGKLNPNQSLCCLNSLGKISIIFGDLEAAIRHHQEQLKLAQEVGDLKQQARALGGIGAVYSCQFKLIESIEYYNQQLRINEELGDREEKGWALSGLGFTLSRLSNKKGKQSYCREAIQHLEASLKIARDCNSQTLETQSLDYLSYLYLEIGKYEEAIALFQTRLDISRKIGDRLNIGSILCGLGRVSLMVGQSENAIGFFQEALIIAREIGDYRGELLSVNGLGLVYCYSLRQYQQALPYFVKSLEVEQKKFNVKVNLCIAVVNLVNCYIGLKDFEKVKFYLSLAHTAAAESSSVDSKGLVIFAEANAHWNQSGIWQKLIGLSLAIKGLLIMPPWLSTNGRLAMQEVMKILSIDRVVKFFRSIVNLVKRLLSWLRFGRSTG